MPLDESGYVEGGNVERPSRAGTTLDG